MSASPEGSPLPAKSSVHTIGTGGPHALSRSMLAEQRAAATTSPATIPNATTHDLWTWRPAVADLSISPSPSGTGPRDATEPNFAGATLAWQKLRPHQSTWEAKTPTGEHVIAIWLPETDQVFPAGWTFFASPPGSATALIPPGSRRFPTLGDVEKAVISMFKEGSQQVIPGLDPVETPHA